MIEIIGIEGSHEHRVAQAIRAAFARQWPGIEDSPAAEEHVKIAANTKLSGYPVSDVDIVVGGVFARPRYFVVRKPIKDRDGSSVSGIKVRVQDFVAAIEVKSQDAGGISISGDEVNVRYQGKWKSATEQNVKQVHALASYFDDQYLDLWIYRCVVLDGINELPREGGLARPGAGAVPSRFTGSDLLTAMVGVNGIGKWRGEYSMSSGKLDTARKAIGTRIFTPIVPTQLDRTRMDRVAARRGEAAELAALLGKKRVHLRGHGGTGKTLTMMQAAHFAYENHGRRSLVLTYNVALAADIQRLLALLGVPSSLEGGGVEVRTTMSFVYTWFSRLGVTSPGTFDEGDFEQYEELCKECLELVDGGAISRADIEAIIDADLERLAFDAIIVDEAQDWPQPEARLLAILYGGDKVSIADGREQLLRGRPTDWSRTLTAGQDADERTFSRCLRMKKNLGIFANTVARLAGLNWEVEPNDEAAGGSVFIVRGSYADHPGLVEKLVASARKQGNDKVDFLHCVSPAQVEEIDGQRQSKLAAAFVSSGHDTWDAVDLATRKDFPRSVEEFRVVQYESCRGLEGWVTVLDDFVGAWRWRHDKQLREIEEHGQTTMDPRGAANLVAWRWSMIALTRPIDTLVICLSDLDDAVSGLILEASRRNEDFVSII